MSHKVLALTTGAAILLTVVLGGGHYVVKHSTKIDEAVTLVTLDDIVFVLKKGEVPRVTRVRPAVTRPRQMRVEQPQPAQPAKPGTKPAAKPQPTTITWTLPYSCSDVRYYNSHFTHEQLDSMRRAAGMALPSADQKRQIEACLAGKVK